MVDTIVLRLHDVRKHRNVIKSLDQCNTKGWTTSMGKVDKKDLAKLRNQGVNDPSEMMHLLKMNRTGEFLVKSKVAKQVNASSHYQFTYMVNYTGNFIEFNFSIPKYVYGSNVLLFVDHIGDRSYTYHECCELEINILRAYDRVRSFLRQFFKMEFINIEIDPIDVEVNRIDVCFNQVFRSKQESLKFLEYQKRRTKKHSRNEEGVIRMYDTALMYTTKRYSAKIYHKGSEYQKNDRREHEKINKEKGRQYFKTEQYQGFADKILRYELTIRTGMLNYLHKANLFRRNCPFWKRHFAEYQAVEAAKQRNERIAKKIATLPESEVEAYRKSHPYEKITKEARQVHCYVSKLINKRTLFTFEVDEEQAIYNRQSVNYESDRARFSPGLLKLCLSKLVEFMKEYQIKELPEEGKVEKVIDEYNLRHKKRLPKAEMLGFYNDLLRFGSFRETAKFNYMHRATMYRYKQRFKKIGITDNNLIPLTEDGIPGAALDLRDYHSEHTFNRHFLIKNSFLDMM